MTLRLIKTDKSRAIKFKNASHFIKDECNLNNSGKFSKSFHVIYYNKLQQKCEHHKLHVTFLDSDINVIDGISEHKFYDKRYIYPFFIFRMPGLIGSIPYICFFTVQFNLSVLE